MGNRTVSETGATIPTEDGGNRFVTTGRTKEFPIWQKSAETANGYVRKLKNGMDVNTEGDGRISACFGDRNFTTFLMFIDCYRS